jgi:hypothetical protein
MERRKAIFELIKNTNLNKLTIKKGNKNVRLDLKIDILNPDVEMSEQVLNMLEAYAQKQFLTPQPASSSVLTDSTQVKSSSNEANNDKKEKNSNNLNTEKGKKSTENDDQVKQKSCDSLSNSPAKKVRFSDNSSIDSTAKKTQVIDPKPSLIPPLINRNNDLKSNEKEKIQNHNAEKNEDKEKSSIEQTNDIFCRLCKLPCNNERALHDHVARVHGAKGLNIGKNGSDENNYDDDDFDYMEEEEDDTETYLSSNSDLFTNSKNSKVTQSNKKNSANLDKTKQPKPNVAIRVAKVAYYNSKDTVNSKNPFKSNIFTNGGIRGNFFSQERLPLRSCKIKIKLTNDSTPVLTDKSLDQDDINDLIMTSTNKIISSTNVDRNTTKTIQSIDNKDGLNLVLTNEEIKQFFKSLLNYIPINNVIRLEDLIKKNEIILNELNEESGNYLRFIHQSIIEAKQFGLSLFSIKKAIEKKYDIFKQKMNLLLSLVDLLIQNFLIIPVGVVERVYVAHEFKQHWVIQSCKNLKGRSARNEEYDELNDLDESDEENDDNQDNDDDRINNIKKNDSVQSNKNLNKQFKTVCLIPRPWRYIDGLLNRPVLKKMLENIILYLKSYPNSTFESISSHFCPVLQPIQTLELLEMLERLKCVKKLQMKRELDCDLFSGFTNGAEMCQNDDYLDGNEMNSYYCTQTSIFTIRKIFS